MYEEESRKNLQGGTMMKSEDDIKQTRFGMGCGHD